ncbi:Fanconi anemia core complex-associated protein 20 isoform X1 [Cynocephalus volans]|uniref:Fanconi anemia core complex-associated protein 20 isoform X1 n=1 Tax=Cynocephalus volans TaxID=110931 RepID=UPI002FC97FB9
MQAARGPRPRLSRRRPPSGPGSPGAGRPWFLQEGGGEREHPWAALLRLVGADLTLDDEPLPAFPGQDEARSRRRPPRSSPSDPRPFPGHLFHRPRAPWEALTGYSAGPRGARGPLPGPWKDSPCWIPAGPPVPRSSLLRRGHRPCRAAPCARRSSPLGWPSKTSTATSLSAWQKARKTWCGDPPGGPEQPFSRLSHHWTAQGPRPCSLLPPGTSSSARKCMQ